MAQRFTQALREEYESLFARLAIRPERRSQVASIQARISDPSAVRKYAEVETKTGVPWFVVGIIHNLESSLRFDRHLHNGDPLTARTVQVPRNRPKGNPPFEWFDSAADALMMKGLHRRTDWSIPGIAFVLEQFNGFGYRNNHPHVKSPYLWSFSNVYTQGKYIRDGVFSDAAVSEQCGGLVMLRHMMDVDPAIAQRVNFHAPPDSADDSAPFPNTDGPEDTAPTPPERPEGTAPRYPGRYLQRGMEGDPDVKLVQQRLHDVRADPGTADGDFGEVTEFALKLFQARSSNLAGEPLEIDGVVGPETWAALFGPESIAPRRGDITPGEVPLPGAGTLAATVMDIAAREVGVREVPLGSNRGPRVDEYIRETGLDPAATSTPWCMCFVYWCFQKAAQHLNAPNLVPKKGSVHMAWNATQLLPAPVRFITAAQAQRDPSLVKPGMVFFIDTGAGRGHTGIVAGNLNAALETVEGNTTSVTGSREGIGVFRRSKRKVFDPSMMGFASYG